MINRLFSSFDPIRRYFSLNLLTFFFLILYPLNNKIFLILSNNNIIKRIIEKILNQEIKSIINNKNLKDKTHIFINIFFRILILNLLGLLPFVYRWTSQLIFRLNLALPFWVCFIFFSLKKSFKNFFRHLVPVGTPIILSHFIVIIERVRQIIRPITLSVRLAANITAGHILINLISNTMYTLNILSLLLILLFLLELAVAFIQRYVFTLLLTIYINETTYDHTNTQFPSSLQ